MKVICIANNKGGVGKTTTTINLAYGLKAKGKKVLIVELDGQGNLGQALGCSTKNKPSMFDLLALSDECITWSDETGIQRRKGVDIIPADSRMSTVENYLSLLKYGRDEVLKQTIEKLSQRRMYDFILVDTEPHLGFLTVNALIASDEVIIPLKPETLPLEGAKTTLRFVAEIKEKCNPRLRVRGLLVTMIDRRRNTEEILSLINDLARVFKTQMFNTAISYSAAQENASKEHITVYEHLIASAVAQDYLQFVDEFLGV